MCSVLQLQGYISSLAHWTQWCACVRKWGDLKPLLCFLITVYEQFSHKHIFLILINIIIGIQHVKSSLCLGNQQPLFQKFVGFSALDKLTLANPPIIFSADSQKGKWKTVFSCLIMIGVPMANHFGGCIIRLYSTILLTLCGKFQQAYLCDTPFWTFMINTQLPEEQHCLAAVGNSICGAKTNSISKARWDF